MTEDTKLTCDTEVGDYIDSISVASAMAHDKATFEDIDGKRVCRIAPGYCANGPNVYTEMVFEYESDMRRYRRVG